MAGGRRLIGWLHPYLTSKVVLNMCTQHSWATTGSHPNWTGCHIPPPPKGPDVLVGPILRPNVQCWRHMPCRVSHLGPHAPCAISPQTDLYPGTSPLSARPHVQCRRHMPCRVSHPSPHAPCVICPHTDPYAQPRGSALTPFVTPRPPKPHSPNPF
jgi:hypothetical protein